MANFMEIYDVNDFKGSDPEEISLIMKTLEKKLKEMPVSVRDPYHLKFPTLYDSMGNLAHTDFYTTLVGKGIDEYGKTVFTTSNGDTITCNYIYELHS